MKKLAFLAVAAAAITVATAPKAHATIESFSPDSTEISNGVGGTNSTGTAVSVNFPKYAAVVPLSATTTLTNISSANYTANGVTYDDVIQTKVRTNSSEGMEIFAAAQDVTGTFVADGNMEGRGGNVIGFKKLSPTPVKVRNIPFAVLDSYNDAPFDLKYLNLSHYVDGTYSQNITFTVLPK
jgi:hypothetical protein